MHIDKIVQRFVAKPIYLRKGAGYLSKEYHCSKEDIYKARELARAIIHSGEKAELNNHIAKLEDKVVKFEEDFKARTATLDYKGPKEVKTKEDLIKECEIDLSEWEITKMVHNAWGKEGNQNYQVKAWLVPISADKVFVDEFKTFLAGYKPGPKVAKLTIGKDKPKVCLVLPKQDAHFNKLDINGYNDILSRFNANSSSINNMLAKATATNCLDETVYIVGSDQFNSEWTSLTTKGTPQANILSYQEAFKAICNHEVEIITTLLSYSNTVKIVFIPGNHDQYVGWHLIDWLEAYMKNNERLSFDSRVDNTKYYRYNNSGIMLNHGDAIKPKELAQKFPMGFKSEWSKCENFYIFTGDKHHEMSLDINGIKFYQIPQLSNAKSGWDDKNGYTCSKAEMTAFVITEFNGMSDVYKEIL